MEGVSVAQVLEAARKTLDPQVRGRD
jgi:hypothetical protein